MNDNTVLIINTTSNYDLVDFCYLKNKGILAIPVVLNSSQTQYHNAVSVPDFSFQSLEKITSEVKPHYICCMNDRLMEIIANLRELYQIPGLSLIEAKKRIDKRYSHNLIKPYLQSPQTIELSSSINYQELTCNLNTRKIFIKPHSLSSSEGIAIIDTEVDFNNFKKEYLQDLTKFIVQPYINGELYHCEMIVQFGEIIYANARKYSRPNHEMISENMPIFSLEIENNLIAEELKKISTIVMEKLLIQNGVFHLEFYRDYNNQFIFLELNSRQPGIGLNKMYKRKLNNSLETFMIMIESNTKIDKIDSDKLYYLCGYYPIQQGLVTNIKPITLSVKFEFECYINIGQFYHKPKKLSKAASLVAWSDNIDSILDAYEQANKQTILTIS